MAENSSALTANKPSVATSRGVANPRFRALELKTMPPLLEIPPHATAGWLTASHQGAVWLKNHRFCKIWARRPLARPQHGCQLTFSQHLRGNRAIAFKPRQD